MVSLYDTLGPDVVEYCINHSSARVIFASPAHIPHLLKLAKACATIKVIVCMDSWADIEAQGARPGVKGGDVLRAWGKDVGVKVMDLAERASFLSAPSVTADLSLRRAVEQLGVENPQPHLAPGRKDIASICYTSGASFSRVQAYLQVLMRGCACRNDRCGIWGFSFLSVTYQT